MPIRDVTDYSEDIQDILTEFSDAIGWDNSEKHVEAYMAATEAIKNLLKYGK